jgi:hypothetical protein
MNDPADLSTYPLLDDLQAGHLRHLCNLMRQPDGDWSKMGALEDGQEGLSAYRYQLSHIVYALGLAHYHHLPAAPCVFKEAMVAAIRKMRRREVWGYWWEASHSGPRIDPGLTALRTPWHDPVARENIMYSGHLHAMAGLFAVLFNDDRYEQPGGLTIRHEPLYVGTSQCYAYDFWSLNDTLYWQMVENGWLGVACEPNCIFLVCNQFPMLGFRFHDIRKGTTHAQDAADGYRQAWQDREVLAGPGTLPMMLMQRQNLLVPGGPATDAHTGAIMNAWNRDFVRAHRHSQVYHALQRQPDGTVSLRPPLDDAADGRCLCRPRSPHSRRQPRGLDHARFRRGADLALRARRCRDPARHAGTRRPAHAPHLGKGRALLPSP